MSARAASRLETLRFRQVYRYQPGKANWFAAGLPREGTEAHTPRVADVARRDVPTCRLDERVGAVHDRVREGGWRPRWSWSPDPLGQVARVVPDDPPW